MTGGRTVAVHPETQIVERMVDWVTAVLIAPGVSLILGNPDDSEYVAAPHAARPKVAAMSIPAVKSADTLEVFVMRRDSHRLAHGESL